MKAKKFKVIGKEVSKNCPWMVHHTVLYRGREYTYTTDRYADVDRYVVGETYNGDTFKGKHGTLNVVLY